MLRVCILIDEVSTYTGVITLFVNQGGVRAAKEGDKSLKCYKQDSFNPKRIFESPRST